VNKKVIKKDEKLQDFMKAEEKRLMTAVETPCKSDRKEELIIRLMAPERESHRTEDPTVQDIVVRMEA
jgi:hypothetical protein